MFQPSRRAQVGGYYTGMIDISTNINAQKLQCDVYSNFLTNYMNTNPIFYSILSQIPSVEYQNIIQFPSNLSRLTNTYTITLSSLLVLSTSAQIAYDNAMTSNITSGSVNTGQSTTYQTHLIVYEKYSTMYAVSSALYSSMEQSYRTLSNKISSAILDIENTYSTLGFIPSNYSGPMNATLLNDISTFNTTYANVLVQTGGAISTYTTQDAFDQAKRNSTLIVSTNDITISRYINYSTIEVPNAKNALSTAQANYSVAYIRSTSDTSSGQLQYRYDSTISSINTLSTLIESEISTINSLYGNYLIAQNAINAVSYNTAVINEGNAYRIYNSTAATMEKIETLYSMTLDGLSIPSSLISSIGIQSGGGIYNPTLIISSLQCVTSNANCNRMSTFLSKYINTYFTLSTALPRYYSTYQSTMKIREMVDDNAPQYVSTLLVNLLESLDTRMTTALNDVSRLTKLISDYENKQNILQDKSNQAAILISTNIFTSDEINIILNSGGILYDSENVKAKITTTTTTVQNGMPGDEYQPDYYEPEPSLPGQSGITTIPVIQTTNKIPNPFAMAKDTNGNIYVTCNTDNVIYKQTSFTSTTKQKRIFVSNGVPYGIAIDSNNFMYVMVEQSDPSLNKAFCINIYDADLRHIRNLYLQTNDYSSIENFFSNSMYVSVDTSNIYVVDSDNNRICKISKSQYTTVSNNFHLPINTEVPISNFTVYNVEYPLNIVISPTTGTAVYSNYNSLGMIVNENVSVINDSIAIPTYLSIDSNNTFYVIGGYNNNILYSFTENDLTPIQTCILPSSSIISFIVSLPTIYYIDSSREDIRSFTIQSGGQSNLPPLIMINKLSFTLSTISTQYNIDMSTYKTKIENYSTSKFSLQQNLLASTIAYQSSLAADIKASMTRIRYVNEKQLVQTSMDSVFSSLSTQYSISSALSTSIGGYNFNNINSSGNIQELYLANSSTIRAYKETINIVNAMMFDEYNSEILYYQNTFMVISSYVKIGMFQRQIFDIESGRTVDNNYLSTVSTFTESINTYMKYLNSEALYKSYYIYTKGMYETENANIATGMNKANLLSPIDYNRLQYNYDLYISQVNNSISYRQRQTPKILGSLFSTIFPILESGNGFVNVVYNIQSQTRSTMGPYINITDDNGNTAVHFGKYVSSMMFNYVPTRKNIFNDVVDIPTTTIPTCNDATLTVNNSPVYQSPIVLATPTVTTTVYGIEGRYIELTKSDNNFEILQVIVIDRTGKNVAFKANVTFTTGENTVSSSGLPSNITNGRYSSSPLYVLPAFVQTTPLTNIAPTVSYDTYVGIQENNLSEGYIATQLGGSATNSIFQISGASSIIIDLGATYDITAITYLKHSTGYSPVGLTVTVLNSIQEPLVSIPVNIDIQSTTFDLRLDKTNINTPIRINPVRNGVCGIFGRYVRLSPSSYGFTYNISQIVVVSSSGTNLALNKKIAAYIAGENVSNYVKLIINGTYNSLPMAESFIANSLNSNDYILIDLGAEVEINAVNIYYALSDPGTYTGATDCATLTILTEDYLEAASRITTLYHLVTLKETLDFRNSASAVNCPVTLKWAPYYGIAGIICRHVKLFKASGELAFSKIEIIDKTGNDVAQFGAVKIIPSNTSNLSILNGVADYQGVRPKFLGYASSAINNQSYIVDFGSLCEVCCIRLYGCSDSPNLSNGVVISLHTSEALINTPLISYTTNITSSKIINSFDTRYEPVNSIYPTTVKRKVIRYGLSGTYAQSIRVYGGDSTTQIIDSTGTNINVPSICLSNSESSGSYQLFRFIGRMYEINSVITSLMNLKVELYDCYDTLVSNKLTLVSVSLGVAGVKYYADFRKQSGYINRYAPIKPFINKEYGEGQQGIKIRYVKIYRRNTSTPLYISQILAIDETGKNRAYQKESVCVTNGATSFPSTRVNAVDGFYEAQIDRNEFLILFFQKYKRKSLGGSFQTWADYYAIDLGNTYAINSIIYVCPNGYGAEGEGVIVQLVDSQFNVVATQMVTNLAKVFGVDILDFRKNPTIRPANAPNYLEAVPRTLKTSTDGCGILVQYIRIEQTQPGRGIQISQISVRDTNNFNIAQYKPTYANSNLQNSYRAVDGNITEKNPTLAYCSELIETAYIEINLEAECSLRSVSVTPVDRSQLPADRRDDFNSLTLKIYNNNYDLIGSFIGFVSSDIKNTFNLMGSSSHTTLGDIPLSSYNMLYLSTIGVQASDQLTAYKYNSGLLATSYISSFSTINRLPPMLSVGLNCNSGSTVQTPYIRINGGIPTRYIRVYNINSYIQVSQLMAYDTNGINVAYQKPTSATSTLPGRYAQYATDGYGGFFHNGRVEPNCFISGNNRYDHLEIDLGGTYNIIAVNYVPPKTNTSRNVGTRIQLLRDDRLILNEYPSSGGMIDFRDPQIIPTTQLNTIVSPIITLHRNLPMNPIAISVTNSGIIFSMDSNGGNNNLCITTSSGSQQTINSSDTMVLRGLCSFGENTYTYNWATNTILQFTGSSTSYNSYPVPGSSRLISGYSLALDSNGTNLYLSENRAQGKIYRYSLTSRTISHIYTADFIVSMAVTSDNNLILCSSSSAIKLSGITDTTVTATLYISNSGAFCNITGRIGLSGIAVDLLNNVVFVSDIGATTFGGVTNANVIYAIKSDGTYFILAGRPGESGSTGNNGIARNALFNSPYSLSYKESLGGIFVGDRGNSCVRMINLLTSNVASITTSTVLPELFKTTTLLGSDTATVPPQETTIGTGSSSVQTVGLPVSSISPSNFNIITNTSDTIRFTRHVPVIKELLSISSLLSCCHVSLNGIVFVSNGNRISMYSIDTNGNMGEISGISITGLGIITCMASDNNNLYIVSTTFNNIYKIPYTSAGFDSILFAYIGVDAEYNDYKITGNLYAVCHYKGVIYFTVDSKVCWCPAIDGGTITPIIGNGTTEFSSYYSFSNGGDRVEHRPSNSGPTNIRLNNPCSLAVDSLGNVYFGDSGTNSIHVFIHTGGANIMYPVAGAFRANTEFSNIARIPYLNNVSKLGKFSAYSININGPSGLTFDSDMNLICASSIGCQIYRITNLNGFEPQIEIISGVGVDINNLQPYNGNVSIAKYADLNNPTSISYSPNSNSFIVVDSGNNRIRQITEITEMVVYKGNNGVMPYGYANPNLSHSTNIKSLVVHEDTSVFYIDSGTLYKDSSVIRGGLNPRSNICLYNQIYLYIINSPSTDNYEVLEINTQTNASRSIFPLTIATPASILEYNLCVHENGCLFISYTTNLYFIYLKAKNLSIKSIDSSSLGLGAMCLDSLNNLYILQDKTVIKQLGLTFVYTPQDTPLALTILPVLNTYSSSSSSTTTVGETNIYPVYGLTIGPPGENFIYYCDYTKLYGQHMTDPTNNWSVSGLNNPQGIFYNRSLNDIRKIYIADTVNNRVRVVNLNNRDYVNILREFNNPNGVFVVNQSSQEHIYVTDNTNGGSIWTYKNSNWTSRATSGGQPIGIVVNSLSTIYYTTTSSIYYINTSTNTPTRIDIPATDQFAQLTIDTQTNTVYAPNFNGNIYAITLSNKWSIVNNIRYYTPHQIAFSLNTIYYSYGNNIQSFNINQTVTSNFKKSWTFRENNSPIIQVLGITYQYPIKSIICYDDILYFGTDTQIFKLQTGFNDTSESYCILGGGTTYDEDQCHPLLYKLTNVSSIGVSFDGNIFVSDGSKMIKINDREIFTPNRIYTVAGSTSSSTLVTAYNGDGQIASLSYLRDPIGACYDSNGNIYIADTGNNRTRRIDMETGIISTVYIIPSGGSSSSSTSVIPRESVIDIQVDSGGNIYLLTPTRIYKTNTNGTILLCSINTSAYGYARTMRFDTSGRLHVMCSFILVGSISLAIGGYSITQETLNAEYIALYGSLLSNTNPLNYAEGSLYGVYQRSIINENTAQTNNNGSQIIYNILKESLRVLFLPSVEAHINIYGAMMTWASYTPSISLNMEPTFNQLVNLIKNNSSLLSSSYAYLNTLANSYSTFDAIKFVPPPASTRGPPTGQYILPQEYRDARSVFLVAYQNARTLASTKLNEISMIVYGNSYLANIIYNINSIQNLYPTITLFHTGVLNNPITINTYMNNINTVYNTIPNKESLYGYLGTFYSSFTFFRQTWGNSADKNAQNVVSSLAPFITAYQTVLTNIQTSVNIISSGSLASNQITASTAKTTAHTNYTNALSTYTANTESFQNPVLIDPNSVSGFNLTNYVTTNKKTNILILERDSTIFNNIAESPNTTDIHEGLGIAFDLNNNLYVADYYSNKIYMYASGSRTYTSVLNTGSHKPYGIAVWSNNLYVSTNSSSVRYLPAATAHTIITYPLSTFSVPTPSATPSTFCGTGVKATVSVRYDNIPVSATLALLNPQLLSIDTKGRLLFTQSNRHSVLLIPLSVEVNSIQNIKQIKIKSAVLGKSVNFYSIHIYNASGALQQIYPSPGTDPNPTNPHIAPYTLGGINPVWSTTLSNKVNIASIVIKSNSSDAVGMKVKLYDEYGTNVSTRAVTYKVLGSAGCSISYNSSVTSDS